VNWLAAYSGAQAATAAALERLYATEAG